MSQNKDFFRKMILYIPGRLLFGILSFLPITLLTKLLDPEGYGIYKIIFISVTFIILFTTEWLNQAIIRFWHNFPDKKVLYTTSSFAMIIINTIIILILFTINYIFQFTEFYLLLISSLILLSKPIFNLNTSIYRNMELLSSFNRLELIRVSLFVIGILILVPQFSIYGALYALGFSFFIVNLFSLLNLRDYIALKRENIKLKTTLNELFIFGYPLIFTMFSGVIMASSDQLLLGIFQDNSQVGIYAANYDILEKILLFLNSIFMLATTPKLIKIYDSSGLEKAKHFNTIIFEIFIALFLPLSFFIVLNDKLFISHLTNTDYYTGRSLVVLIVIAMLIYIVNMYIVKGLTIVKKTKVIAKIYIKAAILNLVLNVLLIPFFSIYGAIIATLICYIVLLIKSANATKNINVIGFRYGNIIFQTLTYLVIFIIVDSLFTSFQKLWISMILLTLVFIFLNLHSIKKIKIILNKSV